MAVTASLKDYVKQGPSEGKQAKVNDYPSCRAGRSPNSYLASW
jgi:hypothetical protein